MNFFPRPSRSIGEEESSLAAENARLIEEMGLEPGKVVRFRLLKHGDRPMEGTVVRINPELRCQVPVVVLREDGSEFPYSPHDLEV